MSMTWVMSHEYDSMTHVILITQDMTHESWLMPHKTIPANSLQHICDMTLDSRLTTHESWVMTHASWNNTCQFGHDIISAESLQHIVRVIQNPRPLRVLQCVTVRCSVLQCVAVCCSVLQCVTVRCSALQCVTVRCSVLQCVAVCCSVLHVSMLHVRTQTYSTTPSLVHFPPPGLLQGV